MVLVFMITNAIAVIFQQKLSSLKIDNAVIIVANILLLLLSVLGLVMQLKAAKNKNPNVIVRAVMIGMAVKLLVLATALLVYMYVAGASKSIYAVYVSMLLYFIYTWLEVRIFLQLNPKKNAGH